MDVNSPLTSANFLLYAFSQYDNPSCHSTAEFQEDLKRFKYIKKLVTRYTTTGVLKERLILNHIIVLCNVFGPAATIRMLALKMNGQMPYIKPFLVLMEIMPDTIEAIDGLNIDTTAIAMDMGIIDALRRIRQDSLS